MPSATRSPSATAPRAASLVRCARLRARCIVRARSAGAMRGRRRLHAHPADSCPSRGPAGAYLLAVCLLAAALDSLNITLKL